MVGHRQVFRGKCPDCGSTRINSEIEDWGFPRTYWCEDCHSGHVKATYERCYRKFSYSIDSISK